MKILTKEARLRRLAELPSYTKFRIRKSADQWWKVDGRGYTADMNKARIFTHAEITSMVTHNGLLDKEILVVDSIEIV